MPHKRLLFRSEAREKVLRGATASPRQSCDPTSMWTHLFEEKQVNGRAG
jgi:hypothetical protein